MKSHQIETKLLTHGIKPTAQRAVICDFLLRTCKHPTAEDVLNEVSRKLPIAISRATVYNTLNLFVDKGLVKEVITEPGRVRYDAKMTNHHHFVDSGSGKVYDLDICPELESNLKNSLDAKFKVEGCQITFFGSLDSSTSFGKDRAS